MQRDRISAIIFKKYLDLTHTPVQNNDQGPPGHTVIVEADIQSSKSKLSKIRVDRALMLRTLTACGDAHVVQGTRHIDPALSLYVGGHLICPIFNKHLQDKVPKGNGMHCRVTAVKLKAEQIS